MVHSASGLDFVVPTLKSSASANKWRNPAIAIAANQQIFGPVAICFGGSFRASLRQDAGP